MDGHPSGPPVSRRLERRTRSLGGPRQRDLLRLAPDGVWRAGRVATAAGGLLPHPFTLTGHTTGGLLSVPLSVGFRRLGFPQRPALRCPDFPRTAETARGHPACTHSVSRGTERFRERGRVSRRLRRRRADARQDDLRHLPSVGEQRAALRAGQDAPEAHHELAAAEALEARAAGEREGARGRASARMG